MKRLRGEVDALRRARGALVQDLAFETQQRRDAVAMMQAGFHKMHGQMAAKAKKARVAFVTDLAAGTMKMIGGFHKSRAAMAKQADAERSRFVLGLKRTVAGLRHAVAADLAGAHRFWFGPLAVDAGRSAFHAEHKAGNPGPVHSRPASEAHLDHQRGHRK